LQIVLVVSLISGIRVEPEILVGRQVQVVIRARDALDVRILQILPLKGEVVEQTEGRDAHAKHDGAALLHLRVENRVILEPELGDFAVKVELAHARLIQAQQRVEVQLEKGHKLDGRQVERNRVGSIRVIRECGDTIVIQALIKDKVFEIGLQHGDVL